MNSAGGLIGFWIIALLTLHAANLGETNYNFLNEPNVPFPPARPTVRNLAAICHCGQGRPRYLASFFPSSGASHFRRRGSAINRLESWYSLCCSGQVAHSSSQILCCARQAEMRDGCASTASCRTQTTTQYQTTLLQKFPWSQDLPSTHMLAKG
uniref:uncharacterized protein ecm1a isoform X3 n=1 Tax=Monopterus albus TaxID=43700 RepID=UPI0009B43E8E|nr:uncharacterized protein LOC109973912 isoform X3 [Monopterus albus]XP_020479462.1 uncharacterized protein LOC109973912 isoform X3 [Monopterus albus]